MVNGKESQDLSLAEIVHLGKKQGNDAKKDFKTVFMESKKAKSSSLGAFQIRQMRQNIQIRDGKESEDYDTSQKIAPLPPMIMNQTHFSSG